MFSRYKPLKKRSKFFSQLYDTNYKSEHLLCELEPSSPLPISDIATQHNTTFTILGKRNVTKSF